jgi:hypothetical protein
MVGADVEWNHGVGTGGHVHPKSGILFRVEAHEPLWRQADRETSGGNIPHPPDPVRVDPRRPVAVLWLVAAGLLALMILVRLARALVPRRA